MLRRFLLLFTVFTFLTPAFAFADNEVVKVFENLTVGPNEKVGDVVVVGGRLDVEGEVTGDIAVFGGVARINGHVHGDVAKFGGETVLGPQAQIGGDFSQLGGEFDRASSAVIGGDVEFKPLGSIVLGLFLGMVVASIPLGILLALLGYAILRERRVSVMADAAAHDIGTVLLTGFATIVGTVVMFVLMMKFHIGYFPIREILAAFFLISMLVGYAGVSAWIGRRISATGSMMSVVVIGGAVVALLQAIPVGLA